MARRSIASGRHSISRRRAGRTRTLASDRGQALVEAALVLPLLLRCRVGIFGFGRAYQTDQVLTNAAREGARLAILPDSTAADVQSRVVAYMQAAHSTTTPTRRSR